MAWTHLGLSHKIAHRRWRRKKRKKSAHDLLPLISDDSTGKCALNDL